MDVGNIASSSCGRETVRGKKEGIVLRRRQMLLLLSAGAFNLFFKLLEYPIYKPRLSELIFGLLPLKKRHSPTPPPPPLDSKEKQKWKYATPYLKREEFFVVVVVVVWYGKVISLP